MSAHAHPEPYGRESLATAAPGNGERILAASLILASAGAFITMAPFASADLPRVPSFIPAYQSALFVCDLLTAILIGWQVAQARSKALLVLTAAYLFDAAIIVPHTLTFPGAFSPEGLLGAGPQTTAFLYVSWHLGFPIFILAYARLADREGNGGRLEGSIRRQVATAAGGVILLVVALTLVATIGEPFLPTLVEGSSYRASVKIGVTPLMWMLSFVAFLALEPWRPRSVLDLWLGVVMFAWTLEVAATSLIAVRRYDLGFYAGRAYGLLAATFVLVVLLIELGRLYQRAAAAAAAEQRVRLLAQVVETQEQERHRIARELHDEMGTYLTAMKVRIDMLERSGGADAATELGGLLRQVDDAVDRLVLELRPPTLDDMGVGRAIGQLAERFTAASGIPVHVHARSADERLPGEVETALYRVTQEALTNVWKHAKARTVSVILDRRAADVQLIVEDDGEGFDPDAVERSGERGHFGLVGIRERVRMIDGTVSIESAVGAGTSLFVRVPLREAEAAP